VNSNADAAADAAVVDAAAAHAAAADPAAADPAVADAAVADAAVVDAAVVDATAADAAVVDATAADAAVAEPLTPFHIAIQVRDIAEARAFYKDILGCPEGRSDIEWVDFNLFGHQLVCHLNPALGAQGSLAGHFNQVDGHGVPVPHCGVVLRPEQWSALADRLRRLGVQFIIEPCTRFKGQVGEQSTMFFRDPSGNALEFKAFRDLGQLFATAARRAARQ
jgi:extradiol dioxygenase family protein